VGSDLLHADGRTADGHDAANSRLSQFLRVRLKWLYLYIVIPVTSFGIVDIIWLLFWLVFFYFIVSLFILDNGVGRREDLQVLECICNYAEQIRGEKKRGGTRALDPGVWQTISQHKRLYRIELYPGHGIWIEERKGILVLIFTPFGTVYRLLNFRKLIIRLARDFRKLSSMYFIAIKKLG